MSILAINRRPIWFSNKILDLCCKKIDLPLLPNVSGVVWLKQDHFIFWQNIIADQVSGKIEQLSYFCFIAVSVQVESLPHELKTRMLHAVGGFPGSPKSHPWSPPHMIYRKQKTPTWTHRKHRKPLLVHIENIENIYIENIRGFPLDMFFLCFLCFSMFSMFFLCFLSMFSMFSK